MPLESLDETSLILHLKAHVLYFVFKPEVLAHQVLFVGVDLMELQQFLLHVVHYFLLFFQELLVLVPQ